MLFGGGDLAGVLAKFGRDEVELQLGVNFLFGATGDAAFTLQRRQGIFVQRIAHIVGPATQSDVVLLGSGEIEERRAEAFLVEQTHVHLEAAVEGKAHLVLAMRQNLIDAGIFQDVFGDGVDVFLRGVAVGQGQEQIEIADSFPATAQ